MGSRELWPGQCPQVTFATRDYQGLQNARRMGTNQGRAVGEAIAHERRSCMASYGGAAKLPGTRLPLRVGGADRE